jgi:transposase
MWLMGRLAPDFKTIADFRRDDVAAIRGTCRQFVMLSHQLDRKRCAAALLVVSV